jgi:hypothetical protein
MNIKINNDLTSYITSDDEAVECTLPSYNPETQVPFGSEEEVQEFIETKLSNPNYWIPKLSDEEKAANFAAAMILSNSIRAKQELVASDWADLPSVRNTAFDPHLINTVEFDAYRAALRAILITKAAVVETWPEAPIAVWSVVPVEEVSEPQE